MYNNSMETPLVTIIIPVYNVRNYLEACLASVQKQTYTKLEIIIVDDGSTDGSGVFCDEYAKTDPRAKVIHQANAGLSAARNRGIEEASGDYITFLDSDDAITPDYVRYLFNLCTKHSTKLSICAIKELTLKSKEIDYGADYQEKLMSTEEALGRMLREEGFTVVAYAKLYHRTLWQNIRFPEGTIHEDLGTTYKLIQQCSKIAYGPAAKYIYRKRQDSISSGEFSDQKFDIITMTDQMCTDLETIFPYLTSTIKLRRMHARFSVLRQLLQAKTLTDEQQIKEQEIINYLKANKKDITKNSYATLRDKLAIYTLLVNKNLFKITWQLYSALR